MNFIHKILHPCRRVDELLSQAMDEPLSWLDRMRMGMHIRMCGNCQQVEQQMQTLHEMGGDLSELDLFDDSAPMKQVPDEPPRR